jgi:hypothetical protein
VPVAEVSQADAARVLGIQEVTPRSRIRRARARLRDAPGGGAMNELDLPPRRPLSARTRDRALNTVLDGIDAPPRRRAAPLAAAAVVVGAASAVAADLVSQPLCSGTTAAAPGKRSWPGRRPVELHADKGYGLPGGRRL